jgi:hypothetical protein
MPGSVASGTPCIIRMCFALERINHGVTAVSLCLHLTSETTVLVKEVIEIDLTKTPSIYTFQMAISQFTVDSHWSVWCIR